MVYQIKGEVEIQKGFGLPRLTTAERTAYTPPSDGYTVYDTDLSVIYVYQNTAWMEVSAGSDIYIKMVQAQTADAEPVREEKTVAGLVAARLEDTSAAAFAFYNFTGQQPTTANVYVRIKLVRQTGTTNALAIRHGDLVNGYADIVIDPVTGATHTEATNLVGSDYNAATLRRSNITDTTLEYVFEVPFAAPSTGWSLIPAHSDHTVDITVANVSFTGFVDILEIDFNYAIIDDVEDWQFTAGTTTAADDEAWIINAGHTVNMPTPVTGGESIRFAPANGDWDTLGASFATTDTSTFMTGQTGVIAGADVLEVVYDSIADNWVGFLGSGGLSESSILDISRTQTTGITHEQGNNPITFNDAGTWSFAGGLGTTTVTSVGVTTGDGTASALQTSIGEFLSRDGASNEVAQNPQRTKYTKTAAAEVYEEFDLAGTEFGTYTGSGTPNGVITANVGSHYRDYATGELYRKSSGTGNTGWEAVGGAADRVFESVNQTTHGFTSLQPIQFDGTNWAAAQADAEGTVAEGIVTSVVDVDNFEVTTFGVVTVTGHGLTVDEYYWLDQGSSAVTATQPTTGLAQSVLKVRDANTLFVSIEQPFSASSAVTSTSLVRYAVYGGTDDVNITAGEYLQLDQMVLGATPFIDTDGITISTPSPTSPSGPVIPKDGIYQLKIGVSIAYQVSANDVVLNLELDGVNVDRQAQSISNASGQTDGHITLMYTGPLTTLSDIGVLAENNISDFTATNVSIELIELPSTTVIPATALVTDDQSASGYMDIGEMRIQWGSDVADGIAKPFPVPFKTGTSVSIVASEDSAVGSDRIITTGATVTDYTLASWNTGSNAVSNAGEGCSWQAIGLKP